ncbi:MFS 1 domain containing protein, partial [Trichuris trichiura]
RKNLNFFLEYSFSVKRKSCCNAQILRFCASPEFLLLFYGVPCGVILSVLQPFLFQNICLHYSEENFDVADCQGGLSVDLQMKLEASTSIYQIFMQLAAAIPGIISVLFVATWSDEHGRKLPLIFALAGAHMSALVMTVSAGIPSLSIHWMLFSQVLTGLCGHCIILSLSFAMIADIVHEPKMLTIRMGTAGSSYALGLLVGTLLCSFRSFAYTTKFALACGCFTFGFFFALFFLAETYQPNCENELTCLPSVQRTATAQLIFHNIKSYFCTFLKPRSDAKRACSVHFFELTFSASVLGGMASVYFPAFRSFLPHMVDQNERARLFTAVALLEQIAPLLSSFVFNYLFAVVVSYFPGTVFLISAAIQFVLFCTMAWIRKQLLDSSDVQRCINGLLCIPGIVLVASIFGVKSGSNISGAK